MTTVPPIKTLFDRKIDRRIEEFARRLMEAEVLPQLVFVTAFDQYAIEAFSVNAVDYVLKPIDAERLEQTLDRVRRRLASEQASKLPLTPADLEKVIALIPSITAPTVAPLHPSPNLKGVKWFSVESVLEEAKGWRPTECGTPQGGVISPLLANLYLNPLDHPMAGQGWELVR